MEITIPYYEDNSRISNSNIGMYIRHGPRYLKDILDGSREGLTGTFLEKGTMIHMYILQPEEFWQHYEILNYSVPKSAQQKQFCENWHNSIELDYDKRVIDAYRRAYVNKKTDAQAIQEGNEILNTYKDYVESLKIQSTGKTVISFSDLTMLKQIKSNLEKHKKANELLYNLPNNPDSYNEFHINWEFPIDSDNKIKCKSLLDRVIIDHDTLTIKLVDIKTTADVNKFHDSMTTYAYYRQLSYYWMAIFWYFKYVLDVDIEDYTYETYIIAIQSNDKYEVRVFSIDPVSIEREIDIIRKSLTEINWHKQNDLWDYRREYYEGDGAEQLAA